MKLPNHFTPAEFDTGYRLQSEQWSSVIIETALLHGVSGKHVKPFSDGSNLIAALDDQYLVKIFPPFHRYQWESEHRVMKRLEGELSFPIPKILAMGERDDHWPYIIMTLLPGVALESVWRDLSHGEKKSILEWIGRSMAEVHSVPVRELQDLDPPWPEFIDRQRKGFLDRHKRHRMPEWFLSETPLFIRDLESFFRDSFEPVILTGEYTPFNLLAERVAGSWRISGMIDFGDAMIGRREYDFLGPSLFLAEGNPELVRSLFQGYGLPLTPELAQRLMGLQILHRYSYFEGQLRIPDWKARVRSLSELQKLIWPLK